jgi:hypothetical protein
MHQKFLPLTCVGNDQISLNGYFFCFPSNQSKTKRVFIANKLSALIPSSAMSLLLLKVDNTSVSKEEEFFLTIV